MSRIGTPAEGTRLYGRLGLCYALLRRWHKAKEHYETMLEEARKAGDREQQWEALQQLAMLGTDYTADPESDDELFRGVKQKAEQEAEDKYYRKYETSVELEAFEWSLSDALGRAEEALRLARESGRKDLTALSMYAVGLLGIFAGRWRAVASGVAEARTLFAAMGNRPMEAEGLNLSAWGEVMIGNPQEALRLGRERLAVTQELGDQDIHVADLHGLVLALLEVGEYEEALTVACRAEEAARSLGSSERLHPNLVLLGDAERMLCRLEEARSAYDGLSRTVNIPQHRALTHSKLCAVAALEEDWEGARDRALQAAALRGEVVLQLTAPFHRHHEIEALLRGGQEELARQGLRRFAEAVGNNQRFLVSYLRAQAVLERWEGETKAAIERLHEAEVLADEIGLPRELWQIRAWLGEWHEERGEEGAASRAFTGAADVVGNLAERIRDKELKEGFLGAPPVRRALGWARASGEGGR